MTHEEKLELLYTRLSKYLLHDNEHMIWVRLALIAVQVNNMSLSKKAMERANLLWSMYK